MSTLPYDKVYAIDQTRGIATTTPVPSLNIASVIQSETGPVEVISVANQSELVDNYCTGSIISASDNETIQFNGALLTAAPVDIVRADTSSLRIGMGSAGTRIYFDKDYNKLDTVTKFSLSRVESELTELYVKLDDGTKGGKYYYLGEPGIKDEANAVDLSDGEPVRVTIENFFNLLYSKGICLSITSDTAIFTHKVLEFSDNIHINKVGENLYSELSEGSINTLSVDASLDTEDNKEYLYLKIGAYTFYDKSNSENVSSISEPKVGLKYSGSNKFTASMFLIKAMDYLLSKDLIVEPLGVSVKATLGDKVVVNDIRAISELIDESQGTDTKISITDLVNETKGPVIYYKSINCPTINASYSTIPIFKYTAPSSDKFYQVKHATDKTNDSYFDEENNYLVIDDTCYYSGPKPTVSDAVNDINVSKDKMSVTDFIDKTFELMLNSYLIGKGQNNTFIIDGNHKITVSDKIKLSGYIVIDQDYSDEFAIVCKFTSSNPLFNVSYVKLNDEFNSYELTYKFKNVEDSFTFSFDGNAVSSTGASTYYEKYNEDPDYKNNYIYIVKLQGDRSLTRFDSGDFGNEVLNNPITESAFTEAILKYIKMKDKQYQFVTDAGHCSVALANACKQVADEKFAQYVPSIPVNCKKVAEIKKYVNSINMDDFRCQYLVPAHKNTYNGNFLTTVPASLSYMFARINAFKTVSGEFNPLFGSRKGGVIAPNLVAFFDDEEAQELADMNINVITKDMTGTYIRSNFTSQKENSYLSEDQNAYMTNVISQECELYNPEIVAEVNTNRTRDEVVNVLTTRLNKRLKSGKEPTVANIKVICDESLNTLTVIEARQLIYQVWVQYSPSVAYVLAYVHVKRLGSF